MLPDLDHPSGTIAQTFGPFTSVLSRFVNTVSGGHRNATHSQLFAVVIGAAMHVLASWSLAAFQIVVVLVFGLP